MRVLICGDRNFSDKSLLDYTLAKFDITEVVEGEARGADTMAREWAEEHNIPVLKFPADWDKYGKGAGIIRNLQMLNEGKPDYVIAFLSPKSVGTANMINQTKSAGLGVHVVNIP